MDLPIIKENQGFTLVEIMVAIALVGILTGLAVPQYSKYQSLAKQTQAKLLLSSIWTAEQSFSIQSGSYTACINQIGVNPVLANPLDYYGFGFNTASVPSNQCGPPPHNQSCFLTDFTSVPPAPCVPGTTVSGDTSYTAGINMYGSNAHLPSNGDLYPKSAAAPANVVSWNTFYAMAVGSISTTSSPYDRWWIDNNKNLINDSPSL